MRALLLIAFVLFCAGLSGAQTKAEPPPSKFYLRKDGCTVPFYMVLHGSAPPIVTKDFVIDWDGPGAGGASGGPVSSKGSTVICTCPQSPEPPASSNIGGDGPNSDTRIVSGTAGTGTQDQIDALDAKIAALVQILESTRERLAIVEAYCLRLEAERKKAREAAGKD